MDRSLSNLGAPYVQQGDGFNVVQDLLNRNQIPQLNYNAMPLSQNIDDRRGQRAQSPLDLNQMISPGMWDAEKLMQVYGMMQQPPYSPSNVPAGGLSAAAGANDVGNRSLADLFRMR